MTSREFKAIITTVPGVSVFHNKALKAENNFIVWGEVGKIRLKADDITAESVTRFAVEFYTKEEYSETPAEIEHVLENGGLIITDYAVNYEEDTGFTHYAYTVEG